MSVSNKMSRTICDNAKNANANTFLSAEFSHCRPEPHSTLSKNVALVSPLHSCSKPCPTGTHNETVKKLTLFFALINRIMIELRLVISNPVGMLSVFQSNRKCDHICCNHGNSHISQFAI